MDSLADAARRGPRLAVFDMDGTLVDSQHMIVAAMGAAFAAMDLEPPPGGDIRRVVGLSLGAAIGRLAPNVDVGRREMLEDHYKNAFAALREAGEMSEMPFDGAFAALDALSEAGWVLGIATGKSVRGLNAILERFALAGRFATLQTADTNPGKPAPDMLRQAMIETGAQPMATVMIGDTSFDMEMARNARVPALGVGWGYHGPAELLAAGAADIIDAFGDLPPAVEGIIQGRAGKAAP
ncbi:MAG: HAD-IA family hydrolase [Alphaproteobacteria bacterium]|nr:HAD-IA family hydrolase [Alphaproteobacteria bacterium]